jgi:hypothetical protein
MDELRLSPLAKTWILDLDGTLVEHNGYMRGCDRLLPGVKEFFAQIPDRDFILILTARDETAMPDTLRFLEENGLRYDHIVNNLPIGERILFNDRKPSGLAMSYAVNLDRDKGIDIKIIEMDV